MHAGYLFRDIVTDCPGVNRPSELATARGDDPQEQLGWSAGDPDDYPFGGSDISHSRSPDLQPSVLSELGHP